MEILSKGHRPEAQEEPHFSFSPQAGKKISVPAQTQAGGLLSHSVEGQPSALLVPSVGQRTPNHAREGDLLYSV